MVSSETLLLICAVFVAIPCAIWTPAERDLSRVGMTLLKVEPGVDTGPVFGYCT